MTTASYPRLSVAVERIGSPEVAAVRWRALQETVDHSFFQSWHWIGCLLATTARPAHLLSVIEGGETRAVAVLFAAEEGGAPVGPGARLAVNRTGDPAYDCIYPEYSGLLCAPGGARQILVQVLDHLRLEGCDRVELGGVDPWTIEAADDSGWLIRELDRKGYYHVDLEALRRDGRDYAATLSRNTRQQIRRSIRGLEERHGPLRLLPAASQEQALEFFGRMANLHQAQWRDRGQPGAFSVPFFRAFHETLIATSFPDGVIDLVAVMAGQIELGFLYGFRYRGHVYYYQSGFAASRHARERPGMVSHFQNIQRHLAAGERVYDFLAGDQRYKASLATRSGELVWLELRRRSGKYRLTNALRNVKAWATDR